ncbi:MAG: hypothetical protein ACTSU2_15325 [Promethearchaeota archaeon]
MSYNSLLSTNYILGENNWETAHNRKKVLAPFFPNGVNYKSIEIYDNFIDGLAISRIHRFLPYLVYFLIILLLLKRVKNIAKNYAGTCKFLAYFLYNKRVW